MFIGFIFVAVDCIAARVKNYVETVFEAAYVAPFTNTGSLRLFLYDVPEGTDVTQWCFSGSNKQKNPKCPVCEVIV